MSFEEIWRGTKFSATHKYEYLVESILNQQFYKYELRARRVIDNPFSSYDLGVYIFDYNTLKEGNEICKVDLERKPTTLFPKDDLPENWIRNGKPCASFAFRKTKKLTNDGRDVYMLIDMREKYPKCIWVHYDDLRTYGKYYEYTGYKNQFLCIHDKSLLNFNYHSFISWCNKLKNREVISDKEQYESVWENLRFKFQNVVG
jgi:hypothetical protein